MSSLISTDSSIPEKIRSAWIAHPKSRITLGLALLAGGLVATASGATAVAGVLLATRASISAIGGYITSTGLIDLIPAKNTGVLQGLTSPAARRIVGITAGGVAGLLALGGLDIPPSTSALEHILPSPVSLTSSSLL